MSVTSRSLLGWTGLAAVCVFVAWRLDTLAYHWTVDFAMRTDAGRATALFQAVGHLPTWFLLAAAFALADRTRSGSGARPKLLASAGVLAGAASVVLKLVIRRERPLLHDGEIWFRPFSEKLLSSSGLGMPSGETSVAFAGVFVLYRLFPAAWPIWFLLGYGCAFSRMLVGQHFLSDVVAGAFLGCACACVVWRWFVRADDAVDRASARPGLFLGLFKGAAWLALLLGVVFVLSRLTAWKPATADDVPGIYTSLRVADGPKLAYYFEPDGRYTSTALHETDPPRLEHATGTWSFAGGALRMDGGDPMRLEFHSRLLRLNGDAQPLVLYREERWSADNWVAGEGGSSDTP